MNEKLYKICVSAIRPFIKLFFPYEVSGTENIKNLSGGYVICSNHLSNVDPIYLALTHAAPIQFMAKQELFKSKIFSKFLCAVGVFPIKRGKGDKEALNYALGIPKSGGILGIFIEGTRSKTGEFLRPRSGAAFVASQSGADVLPVCITGGGENNRVKLFKKTKICYGKAINSADLTIETRQDLKKSTNLIMDNIKKLREDKIENISC